MSSDVSFHRFVRGLIANEGAKIISQGARTDGSQWVEWEDANPESIMVGCKFYRTQGNSADGRVWTIQICGAVDKEDWMWAVEKKSADDELAISMSGRH
jgi:hypothetical protein